MKLEERIIEAYRDGSDLGYIVESFNISHEKIKSTLINLKENSRYKRTFADEFKKIIAERDMNGVSRRQISLELEINANTVKRACEQFGQARKEKAQPVNEFTKVTGTFRGDFCPTCKGKNVNEVEDKTIYCFDCGDEHELYEGYALRVNWEHID